MILYRIVRWICANPAFFDKFSFFVSGTKETLIKKSKNEISKTIIISDEFLFVEEDYKNCNLIDIHPIIFTLRTFADVNIEYINAAPTPQIK